MISDTDLKAPPLSDDNVEENMEDILSSIRQIMSMDGRSSGSSPASPAAPTEKRAGPYPDIPHIIQEKAATKPPASQKDDGVLVLKKSSPKNKTPAKTPKAAGTKKTEKAGSKTSKHKSLSLPDLVQQAMRSAVEQWMVENLERIVEEVVRDEIKKILNIPKSR